MLCTFHHHLVHEGGWSLTAAVDGAFLFHSPAGKPLAAEPPYERVEDGQAWLREWADKRILDTGPESICRSGTGRTRTMARPWMGYWKRGRSYRIQRRSRPPATPGREAACRTGNWQRNRRSRMRTARWLAREGGPPRLQIQHLAVHIQVRLPVLKVAGDLPPLPDALHAELVDRHPFPLVQAGEHAPRGADDAGMAEL